MKKCIIKSAGVFTLSLCVFACSEDLAEIDSAFAPENKIQTIDSTHFKIIESLGYSTENIIEMDDCYVVEGDIAIMKEDIESYPSQPQTRQARTRYIITCDRERHTGKYRCIN